MNRLVTWSRENFLAVDTLLAVLIVASFALWFGYLGGEQTVATQLAMKRGHIYATLASIFGALLGFAITGESILMSVSSNDRLALVTESQQYGRLWAIFTEAVRWLGVATLTALTGLIADRDDAPANWAFLSLVAAGGLATIRVIRLIWALERVVQLLSSSGRRGAR